MTGLSDDIGELVKDTGRLDRIWRRAIYGSNSSAEKQVVALALCDAVPTTYEGPSYLDAAMHLAGGSAAAMFVGENLDDEQLDRHLLRRSRAYVTMSVLQRAWEPFGIQFRSQYEPGPPDNGTVTYFLHKDRSMLGGD